MHWFLSFFIVIFICYIVFCDIKAFEILGISVGSKWEKIYNKFKILVKKFHPDMNSGNKKFEEKLKSITLAYTQLKNTYREKIDTKYK